MLPNETLSGIFLNRGLEPVKSSVHGRYGRHLIESPVSRSRSVPELRRLHHSDDDLAARNGIIEQPSYRPELVKQVSVAHSAKIRIWDIAIMARLWAGR